MRLGLPGVHGEEHHERVHSAAEARPDRDRRVAHVLEVRRRALLARTARWEVHARADQRVGFDHAVGHTEVDQLTLVGNPGVPLEDPARLARQDVPRQADHLAVGRLGELDVAVVLLGRERRAARSEEAGVQTPRREQVSPHQREDGEGRLPVGRHPDAERSPELDGAVVIAREAEGRVDEEALLAVAVVPHLHDALHDEVLGVDVLLAEGQPPGRVADVPGRRRRAVRGGYADLAAADARDRGQIASEEGGLVLDVRLALVHQHRLDLQRRAIGEGLEEQSRATGDHGARARGSAEGRDAGPGCRFRGHGGSGRPDLGLEEVAS